jgi:hypothetical protein
MVVPSPDDPATGQVLSSNLQTTYSVNGSCSCQAGAHGRGCKHMQAWKLYQYIARKVEVQTASPPGEPEPLPALGEAPASANVRVTIAGREVQVTLRDTSEERLLVRLQTVLERFPVPEAPRTPTTSPEGFCALHQMPMRQTSKNGRTWWSHKTSEGWCKGRPGGRR